MVNGQMVQIDEDTIFRFVCAWICIFYVRGVALYYHALYFACFKSVDGNAGQIDAA